MTSNPSFEVSVYRRNDQLKSGYTSIKIMLIICLSFWKVFFCSLSQIKGIFFANKFVIDVAIVENS